MRFTREWVDAWLAGSSTDTLIRKMAWKLGVGAATVEEATL
jgi:hypothetical protein